jgi:hypothetical protein
MRKIEVSRDFSPNLAYWQLGGWQWTNDGMLLSPMAMHRAPLPLHILPLRPVCMLYVMNPRNAQQRSFLQTRIWSFPWLTLSNQPARPGLFHPECPHIHLYFASHWHSWLSFVEFICFPLRALVLCFLGCRSLLVFCCYRCNYTSVCYQMF